MLNFLLLGFATFIWGAGFVATRWTFIDYSEVWSNSLRFVIAGVLSLALLLVRRKKVDIKSAVICGGILLVALQLQTIGIKYTTLAKSGFLTAFYGFFTPILSIVFLKAQFKKSYWLLLGLAFTGIALLCNLEVSQFNKGDAFILTSAFFFAIHILAIDQMSKDQDPFVFNLYQCIAMGVLGFIFAYFYEGLPSLEPLLDWRQAFAASSLAGFIILAFFSSIIAFTIQVYAQKGIKPHIVSLIFLLESVFSATFGYLIFDEVLTPMAIVGAGLVLLSVVLIPIFTRFEKPAH